MNKDQLKKIAPYLVPIVLLFYIFPIFAKDINTIMNMLLLLIPLGVFMTSFVYGRKHAPRTILTIKLPIMVGILFIPSVFIFFNSSALAYALTYALISFIGSYIGGFVRKLKNDYND